MKLDRDWLRGLSEAAATEDEERLERYCEEVDDFIIHLHGLQSALIEAVLGGDRAALLALVREELNPPCPASRPA